MITVAERAGVLRIPAGAATVTMSRGVHVQRRWNLMG